MNGIVGNEEVKGLHTFPMSTLKVSVNEHSIVSYDGKDLETLAATPRYQRWIIDQFAPHIRGRTVEYGSGVGTISELLLPHAEVLHLVEPSPPLAPKLKQRFADHYKVEVLHQTLEAHVRTVRRESYDTIVIVNVLEHIRDDADALAQMRAALVPNGKLLVFVPAMRFLFSNLDRYYGHHRRYTRPELASRLEDAGFVIQKIKYMDFLGIVPWYLLNTLGGKIDFNPLLVRAYDSVGVPMTRFAESLVSPPIGKNLIAVACNTNCSGERQ